MGGGGDKLGLLWGLITKRDENGDKSCLIQALITESIVHDVIESEG